MTHDQKVILWTGLRSRFFAPQIQILGWKCLTGQTPRLVEVVPVLYGLGHAVVVVFCHGGLDTLDDGPVERRARVVLGAVARSTRSRHVGAARQEHPDDLAREAVVRSAQQGRRRIRLVVVGLAVLGLR